MKRRTLITAGPAAGLLAMTPFAARAQARWLAHIRSRYARRGRRAYRTGDGVGTAAAVAGHGLVSDAGKFGHRQFFGQQRCDRPELSRRRFAASRSKPSEAQPVIEVTSRFRTRDRKVELKPGAGMLASAAEQAVYLKPTEFMPTDGIVRETALKATRGARTDVEKARAIYDWAVENTERNAKTRGCGVGDIKAMLESNNLNGKCADLNALFVALARSVGVPARDVYGVRVADSKPRLQEPRQIRRYHAGTALPRRVLRAEHWLGAGRSRPTCEKSCLEEKPGLSLNDDVVKQARSMLWGGWEGNWLAYNYAHDVRLPGSSKAPVPFLMYPQAENAQGRIDSLDPDNFKYRMSAREIS